MRVNLVVSNCTELWIEGTEQYQFLTENCRDYALANGVRPEQCLSVPGSRLETQGSIEFIESYLTRLLPVIAGKLAQQHGHGDPFWRRAIFFYLRDLIGSAYTVFEQIETVFDPAAHELRIASLPDKVPLYGVSATLEDGLYWGITDEGREYYAAEYFRLFYPGTFAELPLRRKQFALTPPQQGTRSIVGVIRDVAKAILRRGSSRLRVMVTNAQYEQTLAKKMFLRSFGAVSFHHTVPSLKSLFEERYAFDPVLRKQIAQPLTSSQERFEQYLGRCIETSLPWALAEGFDSSYAFYWDFWAGFPGLQYVISENLYQQDALPRAVCALQGVELVTLPHFFPLEIYATAKLNRLQEQDRFIARGASQLSPLAISSGTIFPYCVADSTEQKDIDTLYVTTDFYAYFQPLQQSADGCGYDVFKCFKQFVGAFLSSLPQAAIEKISLKKRPPPLLTSLQMDYPDAMRVLDPSRPAKTYMGKAKLIIVEGMSTSLFESLASNIPTIAFWPADLYHLGAGFEGYFSALEEAGIIVHDPRELALQVETAQRDPHAWWFNPERQAARARFMNQNLHGNEHVEKVLLGLAKGKKVYPLLCGLGS